MIGSHRSKIAAGAVALAAIAGGGAAIAATQGSSPKQESDAIIGDVAEQLGVTSTKLSDALKKALENRVDAAVSAGRITKEQADSMKSAIESGQVPLVGIGPGFGHEHGPGGHFADLSAAGSYLGMTEAAVRTALARGKTLAVLAKEKGKTVDGLVQALVDSATKQLDDAVADGRLTEALKQSIEGDLKARITDLVNGTGRPPFEAGFGGPPHMAAMPAAGGSTGFDHDGRPGDLTTRAVFRRRSSEEIRRAPRAFIQSVAAVAASDRRPRSAAVDHEGGTSLEAHPP